MSIALDAQFETNNFFYAFYTHANNGVNYIARFVHQENNGGLTSRGQLSSESKREATNASACSNIRSQTASGHPRPYLCAITMVVSHDVKRVTHRLLTLVMYPLQVTCPLAPTSM